MKTIQFFLIFFLSTTAYAGGAATAVVGGATLPEQLIQSGMLNNQLGKQASMVIQQATMIQKQIEQKNELLLLNRTLDPAVLNNAFNQNRQDINSLQTYIGGLVTLSNDSAQLRNAAANRVVDINSSGLTYEEYSQRERELVASGDRRRAQLAAHELSLLQGVNNDAQFIQEMQTKIPATVGAHESTQLLNTQMNRMVAQNATMIQLMAANGTTTKEDAAAEAQRKKDLLHTVGAASAKEREWMRGEIDKLNTTPTGASRPSVAPQPLTEAQKRALGF